MDIKKLIKYDTVDSGGGATEEQPEPKPEKTFTQEQVNGMMAKEKNKQSAAIYKEMGFESEEDAKSFVEKWRKQEEANKTDLEKEKARVRKLENDKRQQASINQNLQYKFDAIAAGCPAGTADDVVLLAKSKMSEDVDFAKALEDVKKQYPSMFKTEPTSTGAGGVAPRGNGKDVDTSGIGERLAKNKAKQMGYKPTE